MDGWQLANGETRQYDYKPSGERNPLFGPMEEKQRKALLLQSLVHAKEAKPVVFEESEQVHSSSSHTPGFCGYPNNLIYWGMIVL